MRMRMRATVAVLAAVGSLCTARTGAAQEVAAPPDTVMRTWSRPNPFLVGGVVLFGASYGASFAAYMVDSIQQIQCLSSSSGDGWAIFGCDHVTDRHLAVPVAGPWMTLSTGQVAGGQWTSAQQGLLVADGVAQGVGVGLMVYGVIRQIVMPSRTARTEPAAAWFVLRPGAGSAMTGVTAVASF